MLDHFREIHGRLVGSIRTGFRRYLYEHVDWGQRLFAIVGPRGVGKTTMLLQHIAQSGDSSERCLYVSADNVRLQAEGLYEVAGEFFRTGGDLLVVDEAHRYPGWAAELKSIHDSFPTARVVVSGSSMLDILKGRSDLSRRMVTYRLPGLSFREFLCIETGKSFEAYDLARLVKEHPRLATTVIREAGGTILDHFRRFLDHGCYPFYREGRDLYHIKLANVVEKVIADDIPSVFGVRPTSVPTLRRLVHLVASSQPFKPNVERIAQNLQVSREFVYNYLEYLRSAGIFSFLEQAGRGFKSVRKPHKVYLDNPNLYVTLLGQSEATARIGAIRESFLLNQTRVSRKLLADQEVAGGRADFRTEDGLRLEVGGRSKGTGQIRGDEDAWLAVDDIEVGSGRRVPLWLFGLQY